MTRLRDALWFLAPLLAAAALALPGSAGADPVPKSRATRPATPVAEPRLVILAFAFMPSAVPNQPAFQGIISREIPREIGRRIDASADLETRFYAVRSVMDGRPRFAVSQRMGSAEEVRYAAREIGGAYVLDGLVSVTERLRFRVRLQDVGGGKGLWQKEYEAPTAQAAALLERAARDLLSALPPAVGGAAKKVPKPRHEPGWGALLDYMEAEDMAFSLESGVYGGGLDPIFDRYLAACQQDPAWDPPADHLVAIALATLARPVGPAEVPLRALERLVRIRPGVASQAALARGLAAAGRTSEAEAAWGRSVAIDPAFIEGWLNVAEARRARGDYPGAASALEKAIALPLPTTRLRARVQSDLGALYLEINEVDRAIARLEASVRENPEDPEAHFRLGSAYARKGEYTPAQSRRWSDRALKEFRTADRLRGIPEAPLHPPGKPRI